MTAIAENDGATATSGVLNAWQGLLARIDAELRQLAAHPARSVVLLPYAQLMPLAARLWAAQFPDAFAPRFETTRNWATRAGWFTPGPHDLSFDHGRDLLTAAALLEGAGLAAQRALLAGPLVEQATQLGQIAASLQEQRQEETPLQRRLRTFSNTLTKLVVAVTGQHREMLHQVLDVFQIKPEYDLDIMRPKQTLTEITTRALQGLESVILKEQPNIILVQGDTTTTFVAGLAAFYNKVAVGHIEAGLRTDNKYDPFPEEMNRRLTSVVADLHFAPTPAARKNLMAEGVPSSRIYVTGNTVIDALLSVAGRPWSFDDPFLSTVGSNGQRMILVTAHRRENWGEPMARICEAIKRVVTEFPDTEVVFAVHKNPIVRETVFPALEGVDRVHLIEPPDYVPFVHLLRRAHLVLTDSGGVQEEAPAFGKPVLVLRDTTERPEGVAAGTARLIGPEEEAIVEHVTRLLRDEMEYQAMSKAVSPYGDGKAAERIIDAILYHYGFSAVPPEPYVPFRETALRTG